MTVSFQNHTDLCIRMLRGGVMGEAGVQPPPKSFKEGENEKI